MYIEIDVLVLVVVIGVWEVELRALSCTFVLLVVLVEVKLVAASLPLITILMHLGARTHALSRRSVSRSKSRAQPNDPDIGTYSHLQGERIISRGKFTINAHLADSPLVSIYTTGLVDVRHTLSFDTGFNCSSQAGIDGAALFVGR